MIVNKELAWLAKYCRSTGSRGFVSFLAKTTVEHQAGLRSCIKLKAEKEDMASKTWNFNIGV